MIYSNVEYLILFFTTLVLFLSFPKSYRARFIILTLASLFFYAWLSIVECLVFIFVVVVSWGFLWVATKDPKRKTAWLTAGVVVMVLHLFFWKYAGWVTEVLFNIAPSAMIGHVLLFPLPAGISFFTLQGIAYLVDYGRGEAQMMRFDKYLLFKSFFPQLVAGPIVRAKEMKPQLDKLVPPVPRDLWVGALLFCVGFAKKVLIADRIAPLIDPVFANPSAFGKWSLLIAPVGFTVQLWADFSGYTDMGRASARMLGLHLPENFRAPYFSLGGSEFWTRWHITLSSWIKDYIFKPLLKVFSGPNGIGLAGLATTSIVTMAISGLWHGAAFNFVLWGLFHGLWLACERFFRSHPIFRMPVAAKWILFFVLSQIGWILFRVTSVPLIGTYFGSLLGQTGHNQLDGQMLIAACFFVMMLYHLLTYSRTGHKGESILERLDPRINFDLLSTRAVTLVAIAFIICFSLYFRPGAEAGSFIYFKF